MFKQNRREVEFSAMVEKALERLTNALPKIHHNNDRKTGSSFLMSLCDAFRSLNKSYKKLTKPPRLLPAAFLIFSLKIYASKAGSTPK